MFFPFDYSQFREYPHVQMCHLQYFVIIHTKSNLLYIIMCQLRNVRTFCISSQLAVSWTALHTVYNPQMLFSSLSAPLSTSLRNTLYIIAPILIFVGHLRNVSNHSPSRKHTISSYFWFLSLTSN